MASALDEDGPGGDRLTGTDIHDSFCRQGYRRVTHVAYQDVRRVYVQERGTKPMAKERIVNKIGTIVAAAVLTLGGVATIGGQSGFSRTMLQQVDLEAAPDFQAVTALADIEPGGSSGRHTHSGDEIGYVLSGTLTIPRDGMTPLTVNEGESFAIPAGTIHDGVNNGPTPVRVLVTYMAPKGVPLTTPVSAEAATADAPAAASGGNTTGSGVFSDEQVSQGEVVYQDRCAACHGSDLRGGGFAPELVGEFFLQGWIDANVGELFSRIQETMPSDNPGTLNNDEATNLTAFLLGANGYPPGPQALPTGPAGLEAIVISEAP